MLMITFISLDQIKNDLKCNEISNFISNERRVSSDSNNNVFLITSKNNGTDVQSKQLYGTETVLCNVHVDDITTDELKKQSCSFPQLNKVCFQQITDITEQEEGSVMIKNIQENKSILHSVSEDIHNIKTTACLDNNDFDNNAKKKASICIITENIIYSKPKYIILKRTPTKTDQKEAGQEILKSSEEKKYGLSDKEDNVSLPNSSSHSK